MDKLKDYDRQLIIANSLYELGIDETIIKEVTKIESKELEEYRLKKKEQQKANSIKKKDIH